LAALRSIHLSWSVTGFSPPCTGSAAVGTLLRAAAVPPYDRASARQPRSRLPRKPDRLTAPGVQVCGVFWQPVFMARLIRAPDRHRPRIRQGGMPAARRIGRRRPGRCRHAQADGGRCPFRSASWSSSPGRGRRSRRRLW
jgi:hypothetical protein